jgi:hypothetical protein
MVQLPLLIAAAVFFAAGLGVLGFVSSREAGHDREVDAERARAGLPPRALAVATGNLTGGVLAGGGALMGVGLLLLMISLVIR